MLFNQLNQSIYFFPAKTTAALKSDRIKPKFCYAVAMLDMNMGRFVSIT